MTISWNYIQCILEGTILVVGSGVLPIFHSEVDLFVVVWLVVLVVVIAAAVAVALFVIFHLFVINSLPQAFHPGIIPFFATLNPSFTSYRALATVWSLSSVHQIVIFVTVWSDGVIIDAIPRCFMANAAASKAHNHVAIDKPVHHN
jgi:hypothetical protein